MLNFWEWWKFRSVLVVSDLNFHHSQKLSILPPQSLGMHEWKQHKPWFDEECLGFLDQRKRAKIQWVQDPCQSNVDNLNSVR